MGNPKLLGRELGRISPVEYRTTRAESRFVVVLDNIRSAHNVGSVFRTADCFGIDRVLLCGISAVPPSAEIHKTGLGAEESVPWEYFPDTMDAVGALVKEGYVTVCVEQTRLSERLQDFRLESGRKYAFIFGNEVDGVRQDVVDASEVALEIPQFGTKHSLNVSVCAGAVLWEAARQRIKSV